MKPHHRSPQKTWTGPERRRTRGDRPRGFQQPQVWQVAIPLVLLLGTGAAALWVVFGWTASLRSERLATDVPPHSNFPTLGRTVGPNRSIAPNLLNLPEQPLLTPETPAVSLEGRRSLQDRNPTAWQNRSPNPSPVLFSADTSVPSPGSGSSTAVPSPTAPANHLADALERLNRGSDRAGGIPTIPDNPPIQMPSNQVLSRPLLPAQPLPNSTIYTPRTSPPTGSTGYTLPAGVRPLNVRPVTLPSVRSPQIAPQPVPVEVDFNSLPPVQPTPAPQPEFNNDTLYNAPAPDQPATDPATTTAPPFSATGQGIGGGQIGTFSNPGVVEQN